MIFLVGRTTGSPSPLDFYIYLSLYSRAGLGLSDVAVGLNASDPGEAAVLNALGPETTAVRMVSDLHRLITFARPLQRPLVLVGSELGRGVNSFVFPHTLTHKHLKGEKRV